MTQPSNTKDESKQILLCNTHRSISNFFNSLKFRLEGGYKKIPNYLVEDNGIVHHLNTNDVTETYLAGYKNEGVIVICLENRGWLTRRNKDGKFVDWLGDIYNNKVHEKKWRGKLFWDRYRDVQMEATLNLIKKVCNKHNIPEEFIGHNVLVDGIENFNGIVTRSNYNEYWTDINPSFNFELL
tara:strand:+ start:999 stop:1547 length:549 start_codon:yes stop_codon:yes gene_type:complete